MTYPKIGAPVGRIHVTPLRLSDGSTQMAKVLRIQDLRLPIHLCLGSYEAATQEELNDAITDLNHELERRASVEYDSTNDA